MSTVHSQTSRLLRKIDCASKSLLIVEDNDASRRLVMELLRAAGFTHLSFARDAEEAIEHIQTQGPDLLLLDWGLPGMSGIELVNLIRQAALKPDLRFPNPQLPIVMLTARQRVFDVTVASHAGINEFVVKPFSTSTLLKAISAALVKKRQFITTPDFVGPDRRRRKSALHPGLLLRREGDADEAAKAIQNPMAAEIEALRGAMRRKPGQKLNRDQINQVVVRLMHTQTVAHDLRMRLIEQATKSLNAYVHLFGEQVEGDVLDVHLDALIRLNEAPHADPDEAVNIVKHLNTLVNKRKASRKVSQ